MDSLSLLRELLPNDKLASAEREMSMDFKAAAQSLAAFYKSSKQTVKHAHDAGYAACLQDMLQFIQTGLSTAGQEGDAMGVARVMDWVEGQLDRYKEGKGFDAKTRETAEARSPSQTPRRASTASSLPADSAPIPAPIFTAEATPATKRRHAAIANVDPAPARRRS